MKVALHTCNDSTVTKTYRAVYRGTSLGSSTLPPGACWDLEVSDDQTPGTLSIIADVPYYNSDGAPVGTNSTPVTTIAGTDSGWGTGSPPAVQIDDGSSGVPRYPNDTPGVGGTPTNYVPPVPFSGSTNGPNNGLALDSTLKQVGNSLYTAVNGGFQTGSGIDAANGQKLGTISSGINGLGSKLDGVNSGIAGLGGKLDTLHNDNGTQSTSLSSISTGISTLNGTANSQLTQLQQIVANTAASGGGMSNQLGQMIGLLVNLTNGVNSDTPWLARVDNGITNVNNNLQGNYTKLGSIDNNGYMARVDLDGIKSDTGVVRENSGLIKNDLDAANGFLQTIAQKSAENVNTLQSVLTQLQNLNTRATQTNVYDPQTWQQLVNIGAILQTNNGEMQSAVVRLDVLSNYMDLMASRLAASTNIAMGETNELARFHRDNTNLLTQIRNELTNTPPSDGGLTNTVLGYDQASGLANQVLGSFDAALNYLSFSILPPVDDDLGDIGTSLQWTFMGYTIDFNPLSNSGVAGIANLIKTFIAWLLVAAYLTQVVKDSYEMVKVGGSANQMQFPNIEAAGFSVGLVAIPVLIIAMMTLMGVLFGAVGVVFAQMAGDSLVATFHNNPLSGAEGYVAVGVNLARHFFPFATLFALTGSYMAWRFTMTASGGFLNMRARRPLVFPLCEYGKGSMAGWRASLCIVHGLTVWATSSKAARKSTSAPMGIFMRPKSLGKTATSCSPSQSSAFWKGGDK